MHKYNIHYTMPISLKILLNKSYFVKQKINRENEI